MANPSELARLFDKHDREYFAQYPDRKTHLRKTYKGEQEAEFQQLGWHLRERRRILLTRVDFERKPLPDNKVLKIPFLPFADETIEDRDDVLLPILEQIMQKEIGGVQ